MKLKYLGTAAAEGFPAMFCTCETCEKSRKSGGRNIRTRSQAIIDDKILIDFPADTYMHVLYHNLELWNIKTCIVTHNHSDHLYSSDLEMRRETFAQLKNEGFLTIYATKPAGEDINRIIFKYNLDGQKRVRYNEIEPFTPFEAEDYIITPLAADHDVYTKPVFYLIEHGGKTIMYANDTGYFPESTWEYIKKKGCHIDLVSLDCTAALLECRYNHMSLSANIEVKKRLESIGCTDSKTVYVANHFSHNGGATYDEVVSVAKKGNFLVSYDGMEVEI